MPTPIYQHQPYTYLIGWSLQNKWYYGCRYADNCNPDDLWVTYFTSSIYVKEMIRTHGNPDIIKIRKIFSIKSDAVLWEARVLKKLYKNRKYWLNRRFSSTKFIIDKITIQNNIDSKKNRTPEYDAIVKQHISNGSVQGHLNRSAQTKIDVSKKISNSNKNRDSLVNQKISESVKKSQELYSDEKRANIETKKSLTRKTNKENGVIRKKGHRAMCTCLGCRHIFDPGNFVNHIKTGCKSLLLS